jgi:hypothetical protein
MGELIYIREEALRRDIAKNLQRRHARDRESLARAVDILKQNLHATSVEIVDAPASEQRELLNRAEKFIALIRYGMRMLGDDGDLEPQLSIEKT